MLCLADFLSIKCVVLLCQAYVKTMHPKQVCSELVISYLEMSCESSFSVYLKDGAERPSVTRSNLETAERSSCTFLSVLNLFQIRKLIS